ncbi:MAG TPA: HAMP domain-containing sensor histidine kinase [Holophagaceae bacterium]|nr:HAMP domain-containing sensor histidine kinase [Holophagaceae bacterium]
MDTVTAPRGGPLSIWGPYIWLGLGMAGALGLMALFPFLRLRSGISGLLLTVNSLALAALYRRGRALPGEARGWRIFSGSVVASVLSNGAFVLAQEHTGTASLLEWTGSLLQVLAGLLAVWGLLRLPWRSPQEEHGKVHLFGATLFGGSLGLGLWIGGVIEPGTVVGGGNFVFLVCLGIRLAIQGGVLAYLVAEDPRRFRGPLGLLLTVVLLNGSVGLQALQILTTNPGVHLPLSAGLTVGLGIGLNLIGWGNQPAEAPLDDQPVRWGGWTDALLFFPYLLVGVLFLASYRRLFGVLGPTFTAFMALTAVLLAHQFLMLREIRRARADLEAKVDLRTRELEVAQALMLRNERLNSVALLGAGLAHDLNNALGAITGAVERVRLELDGGIAPNPASLDLIGKAVQRGAGLSRRLMSFAKEPEELTRDFDLALLVEGSEDMLRMLVPRRIQLELDIAPGAYRIHGVPEQVQQVLINLVANAKDAIPERGQIEVRLAREQDDQGRVLAFLSVRDSGSGMGPEVLERLFQPFFTTKEEGKGTGIGLASSRAILDRLGGQMAVESVPGQGTTFKVRIPLLAGG